MTFGYFWVAWGLLSLVPHFLVIYRYLRQASSQGPLFNQREAAGFALFLCVIFSALGPLGSFAVMCMSGFAQHGIFRQRQERKR